MKKFGRLITIIILLGAAGYVFYRGWVQFKVSPDECGVMVSKTGGVDKRPIIAGRFAWRWETLLPTNASIRLFSLAPYSVTRKISRALPCSEAYSKILKLETDFSYSVSFEFSIECKADTIVKQVETANVRTNEELQRNFERIADEIALKACDKFIERLLSDSVSSPSTALKEIVDECCKSYTDVNFLYASAKIESAPDMALYNDAKTSYEIYYATLNNLLSAHAASDAEEISNNSREVIKLSKLGAVLRDYPELSDLLKDGNASETLKALRDIQ